MSVYTLFCQAISECTCENGGTCQMSGCTSEYACHCAEGFIGKHCETFTGKWNAASHK